MQYMYVTWHITCITHNNVNHAYMQVCWLSRNSLMYDLSKLKLFNRGWWEWGGFVCMLRKAMLVLKIVGR